MKKRHPLIALLIIIGLLILLCAPLLSFGSITNPYPGSNQNNLKSVSKVSPTVSAKVITKPAAKSAKVATKKTVAKTTGTVLGVSTNSNSAPVGYVDGVSATGNVDGWALDPDDANYNIAVHFYVDAPAGSLQNFVGATGANTSRPDVNSALQVTGNHGFSFNLPDSFKDGREHTLYVYAIDSVYGAPSTQLTHSTTLQSAIKFTLPTTPPTPVIVPPLGGTTIGTGPFVGPVLNPTPVTPPVTVPPSSTPTAQANRAPIGYVNNDRISEGRVTGWALDPDQLGRSSYIRFYVDGTDTNPTTLVNDGYTDINDQALNEYLNNTTLHGVYGAHGFSYQLPERYRDGREHIVYVYAQDADQLNVKTNIPVVNTTQPGLRFTWNPANTIPRNTTNPTTPVTPTQPTTPVRPAINPNCPSSPTGVCPQNTEQILGAVSRITLDGVVSGNVVNTDTPNTSLSLQVLVDGGAGLRGTATANKPSVAFNQANNVTGNHGFEFRLPASLNDGQEHTLTIYVNVSAPQIEDPTNTNVRYGSQAPLNYGTVYNTSRIILPTTPYRFRIGTASTPTPPTTPITPPTTPPANTSDQSSTAPLVVTASSKVVGMEFEAWFGPRALPFGPADTGEPNPTGVPHITPAFRSSNMAVGYDSKDPAVIEQQFRLIQDAGVNIIFLDMSNGVGCTFGESLVPCGTQASKDFWLELKNNVSEVYRVAHQLSLQGKTNLKIVPLIGAQTEPGDFAVQSNGKTAIEKATDYFLDLYRQYPELGVNYQSKLLFMYYHGAAQADIGNNGLWERTNTLLQPYANQITKRNVAGLFDDQPIQLQTPGQISPIKSDRNFWTWIDRYKTDAGFSYYPSYQPGNGGVEAFTAAVASPGKGNQPGFNGYAWGTAALKAQIGYPGDVGLANGGEYFKKYMTVAKQLKPTFLIVHQWNEYGAGDQGYDANTRTDIEPNSLIGTSLYNVLVSEIAAYKQAVR